MFQQFNDQIKIIGIFLKCAVDILTRYLYLVIRKGSDNDIIRSIMICNTVNTF